IVVEGSGSGASIETLGENLLAVAQVQPWCRFDREPHEVASVSYDWTGGRTMFLLNPGRDPLPLKLEFLHPAQVQGLHSGARDDEREACGKTFGTTLPPFSVVPLSVSMQIPQTFEQVDSHGSTAELA
ncbi:MAG: hypothetical protein HUU37_06835, partial [Bdellovibrionales bacterium]|nr:hypothetical protein [Bdellovibrionales bacterium]